MYKEVDFATLQKLTSLFSRSRDLYLADYGVAVLQEK